MTRLAISAAIVLALTVSASAQTGGPVGAFFSAVVAGTEQMVSGAVTVATSPFEIVRPVVLPPPPRARHRAKH